MENYSYNSSTYPDSRDSSPRSREIDLENASWTTEDQNQLNNNNYKVKFMCSYGGKILPRPHDNQLSYVGGETKILSVDRNIKFSGIISKLNSLCDFDVCFKYQLPGEDLDALISVTNDEDLEHMMIEFDRLHLQHRSGSTGSSNKPARLRLFLFSLNPSSPSSFSTDNDNQKTNQQWFVDALNSVNPISQSLDGSSPPATVNSSNPDFLFGFDKSQVQVQAQAQAQAQAQVQAQLQSNPVTMKQQQQQELPERDLSSFQEQSLKKLSAGSDSSGKEDIRQLIGGETGVSRAEIQRQIHELQRLQIANHEQAMFQRQNDEMLARAFPGDYYMQKIPDQSKVSAMAAPTTVTQMPSQVPISGQATTGYWQQERHVPATSGYQVGPTGIEHQQQPQQQQQQQPVYLVHAPTNMYQTRPVTGQVGQGPQQGYYGMQQRMMQDVYREQPVYNMGPPPPQQPKMVGVGVGGGGGYGDGVNIVRTPPVGGIPVAAETGYTTQVGYDSSGRQVYYTTTAGGGGVVPSSSTIQTTTGVVNQEGKVVKTPQPQV